MCYFSSSGHTPSNWICPLTGILYGVKWHSASSGSSLRGLAVFTYAQTAYARSQLAAVYEVQLHCDLHVAREPECHGEAAYGERPHSCPAVWVTPAQASEVSEEDFR